MIEIESIRDTTEVFLVNAFRDLEGSRRLWHFVENWSNYLVVKAFGNRNLMVIPDAIRNSRAVRDWEHNQADNSIVVVDGKKTTPPNFFLWNFF